MPGRWTTGGRRAERAALVCGLAGPVAFVGAWVVGSVQRAPAYSPVRDVISDLARTGTSTQPLMTAGFVAFGLLVPVYAQALGPALGSRGVRVAATVSGLATLGVAALPLSAGGGQPVDTWHAVAAGTGYAGQVLAPLLGGRRLGSPTARLASYAASALALGCLAASVPESPVTGLLQRTGLTVVDVWFAAVAAHLLLRRL